MPHGHCYLWEPGLVWLQVVTNGVIALSYVAIFATLAVLIYRVRDLPFKLMYLAFGVFILSCGLTHVSDVWVIWRPDYWLDGGLRAVTAVFSLGTAILLPPLVPKAVALASGARAASERGIKLEHAVKDLGTLYEKTRELDRLKTEFFANMSHEFRTPLALILAPTERLLARADLDEEARTSLDVIARNARVLRGHVEDLLATATLEAGKMVLRWARTDLAALVGRSAGSFEALAAERRMTFTVDAARLVRGDADPERLQRVLLNLLSNAFKFTPEGGTVRISLREDGGRAVIEVADSGPGIPEGQREVVFERFRQLEGGTTRRFGGTGLGLSIAREIVLLHGGTLTVGDAREGGASFVVNLPLDAPPGTEVAAEREAPEPEAPVIAVQERRRPPAGPSGAALVLVVEDNADLNRYLRDALSGRYRVAAAFDGDEGLRMSRELRPDLVLTDLMMPGTSGEQLVRSLRAAPDLADVPIVVLTAKADATLRERMLREGVQDWVGKPFATGELMARVTNLIAARQSRIDAHRQEVELRRVSEARERMAADAAGMGSWDLDLGTGGLRWSESHFRLLGLTPTADGRGTLDMWRARIREADLPRILERIDAARQEHSLYSLEHRFARADDGRTRWARAFGRFLYDEATGEPIRFIGMFFDDTARHEADAVRRETEERLGLLVREVREYALFALDAKGRVVSWNEGAERLYGYTAAEALGLSRTCFFPPDDLARCPPDEDLRTAAATGSAELEGWRVRKDGSRFWANVVLTARRDEAGAIAGFLNVTRDLTQRRAADERFRLALECSPCGMVMVGRAGRIVLVNRQVEQLLGFARDELIGRPVEMLVPVPLRDIHVHHRDQYLQAPVARQMGGGRDLSAIRKDGTRIPVEIGLTPVQGEDELFVVAAIVNVAERKTAEAEIRRMNARLEERVADLEAFSYTISHDLRAPLRAMQAYAHLIAVQLGDKADPTSRSMLQRLGDAALRADLLLRDVLNYSRLTGAVVTVGPVDLDALVAQVVADYPDLTASQVRVRTPLGRVAGQQSLLVQVLSNLLVNAAKFVPKGRAPEIDVWTERREDGWLRVVVQDNGVGVAREHWKRIFLPFERLGGPDAVPGTGIGLAIVKKAIERLGGRVGVESELGRGSRFWFELPEVTNAG